MGLATIFGGVHPVEGRLDAETLRLEEGWELWQRYGRDEFWWNYLQSILEY